mmetsp:Transcript_6539/g.25291  ORF Transcript_6539/g.25291 Transcript_6539/m.25291 type:complete len:257 (-) Transcript_6539:453-1223(-)
MRRKALALTSVLALLSPICAFSPGRMRTGHAMPIKQATEVSIAPCSLGTGRKFRGVRRATEDNEAEEWLGDVEPDCSDKLWAGETLTEADGVVEGFGLGSEQDMVLKRRIRRAKRQNAHRALFSKLSHCYVLVFDADTEAEGLYCVEQGGLNIVLGFEAEADARQYGARLQRQGFFNPEPKRTSVTELIAFCWDTEDVKLKLVPQGAQLVPPRLNQPMVDGWGDEIPSLSDLELQAMRSRLETLMRNDPSDLGGSP